MQVVTTDRYTLYCGDCLAVMGTMEANSVDTIVTDPPYGLAFMGKEWDKFPLRDRGKRLTGAGNPTEARGFGGNVAYGKSTAEMRHFQEFMTEWAIECLRVAKPGAMLLAFGGTRTFHRLTCAIEDAGWEVRDVIMWVYGSGFPKSHDISKGIDKAAGAEREVTGRSNRKMTGSTWSRKKQSDLGYRPDGAAYPGENGADITAPATDAAQTWQGWGTALKPAWEPIIVAMKPLDGTFAQNAQRHGVAGLNIEGGRIEGVKPVVEAFQSDKRNHPILHTKSARPTGEMTTSGRWPANLILDEDAAAALDEQSGESKSNGFRSGGRRPSTHEGYQRPNKTMFQDKSEWHGASDTGGASRYFKVVKVAQSDFSTYNALGKDGALCGVESTKDGDTSAGKRTESSADNLSIDGYGNSITGRFLPDSISITRTATGSTMTFPTLSPSTSMSIGTCTIESESDISWLTALSIESVSDASDGYLSISTSDGQQVRIRATVRIASGMPSLNGEKQTGNGTTPICESTANASRFLYCAKASRAEREAGLEGMPIHNGVGTMVGDADGSLLTGSGNQRDTTARNHHPTVKPLALMRYLVRLTATPTGGVVLDPFMGSGTTGVAAMLEGRTFIGIEREPEYIEIARRRIENAAAQPRQEGLL